MEQNHCFIQFCSTNVTIEQICSQFYSVILYLKDIGVLRNLKFWVLRVPSNQISSQNGKIQVLFNKFPETKKWTQNFEIRYTKGTPIQISTKKGSNLCFVKKISPLNKSAGFFGNYNGVQEQKTELRVLRFYLLRVPSIQNPTKKYWT
jgi:hypothetical protein